jgi:hypothetical protein
MLAGAKPQGRDGPGGFAAKRRKFLRRIGRLERAIVDENEVKWARASCGRRRKRRFTGQQRIETPRGVLRRVAGNDEDGKRRHRRHRRWRWHGGDCNESMNRGDHRRFFFVQPAVLR